jgi:DNA-binding SARP family transcriptional activator
LLWPEKEEDESKNVRGVTISNLRKILREIEGVSFVFSEGKFSLQASDAFYCDYLEMLDIINAEEPDMDKFIGLLSRGAFLKSESDPFYDKFKSSVEQRIAPIMQVEIARRFELRQYLTCVTCAEILFGIDPFNDEALYYAVRAYKNVQREDAAAEIYHSFAVRYKNDYGQEYPKSFDEIK